MEAKNIYHNLRSCFGNHDHTFENKYIFKSDWESDFFCVSKSGYCIEVEVKISRSDFRADFKKDKHEIINAFICKRKYLLLRTGDGESYYADNHTHTRLDTPAKYSGIKIIEPDNMLIPNKFWYAVPNNLIQVNEVPNYAGLIYIDGEDGYINYQIQKAAPFIHKTRLDIQALLFDKYHWGYKSIRREIESLKYDNERLKIKYANLLKVITDSGIPFG